jgi:quercetin dioxygenase-like cupin family protein
MDMFCKKDQKDYRLMLDGITMKTMVYGEKTLLVEFRLERGSAIPSHSHHFEQTGYLIAGRMKFVVGNEEFEAEPGDSWCIPGNMEHRAYVMEDSIVVEVFSPVREEYLP